MSLERTNSTSERRPAHRRRKSQEIFLANLNTGAGIKTVYAGIAVSEKGPGSYQYAITLGDASSSRSHTQDISVDGGSDDSNASSKAGSGAITPAAEDEVSEMLAHHIFENLDGYQNKDKYKLIAAGLTGLLVKLSPQLAVSLWEKYDIVPIVFPPNLDSPRQRPDMSAAEEAAYMMHQTLEQFSDELVNVGFDQRHAVAVDCGGRAQLANFEGYRRSVMSEITWDATMTYADSLKDNRTKIAFFSATPQGGGVALMRHALVRFLRLVGVDCTWYVPIGQDPIFRVTKDNHNLLQGVAKHGERLTEERIQQLDNWVTYEAGEQCKWTASGGPLASRKNGGADVIIVDDPQMPSLVKIAKERDSTRPVIYRSHIQVRADLADQEGTPTAEVWNWVWNHVKDCDVFVSHPISAFVPKNVTPAKVGYLPASTDWLDGLNKHLDRFDEHYYIHAFRTSCYHAGMRELAFPKRPYIVQIARFDPAKGIDDVLASYAKLRREYMKDEHTANIPQLVIAGHGAIDDPDGERIFKETIDALDGEYRDIMEDVIVHRVRPSDQILNALMQSAHVALQLSTREGFEVKVSEALHTGVPIIATRAGGIPLQVEHEKSGFLVQPSDSDAVAKYLHLLFADKALYAEMSDYAEKHVSDEVGTVGNALAWLYLADTLAKGEKIEPHSRWINDMAREKAGFPAYKAGETHLPRDLALSN